MLAEYQRSLDECWASETVPERLAYRAVMTLYDERPTVNRWKLLLAVSELVAFVDAAAGRIRKK